MNKYAPRALRALAVVASATSAVAAYPAASSMFGSFPGVVMVSSSAAVIYAAWHIAATNDNTDTRLVSAVVATAFAVAMVAGIHNSSELKQSNTAQNGAVAADTLYNNQESTRMATLATVAAELRATSKREFPDQYAKLQSQIDNLSKPTTRSETAIQSATPETNTIYSWLVAGMIEIISPALLIVAGLFGRRKDLTAEVAQLKAALADAESKLASTEHQLTATANELTATQTATASTVAQLKAALADAESKLASTEHQLTATANELTATQTATASPLDALTSREIRPTAEGNITASTVIEQTSCTAWQAKDAIRKAATGGVLIRSGKGNAARYTYAKQPLRIIK